MEYANARSPDAASSSPRYYRRSYSYAFDWSPSTIDLVSRPITSSSNNINMSSRRQSLRPVVVEVKPDIAGTSPPSPSAKRVSFAPKEDDKLSRPLTSTEAWSLYYFETHARHCSQCYNPLEVYRRGHRLCEVGHGLAQDVACHVYHQNGEIYSTRKDATKLVRVEIPHGYSHLRGLLRSMEREIRHRRRTSPILSYDRSYPVSARKSWTPEAQPQPQPETVTIEPATSSSRRRSIHRPVRYSTVVVDNANDVEDVTAVRRERRGTLYEQRKKQDYEVEIREPSEKRDKDRRLRKEKRDSGFWI